MRAFMNALRDGFDFGEFGHADGFSVSLWDSWDTLPHTMELSTTVKHKRPLGVTAMAVMFLYGGSTGIIFILIMAGTGGILPLLQLLLKKLIHVGPLLTFSTYALLIIWPLAYVLYALIGFGLWRLKSWARYGVILICFICVLISFPLMFIFSPKRTPWR